METALQHFYNAANATFSDADHMLHEVPSSEAGRYFQRNREAIGEQLRKLTQAYHDLEETTKETET